MNKEDALGPIRNLQKRLDEIADGLALDVAQFVILPQSKDVPMDLVAVAVILRQDAVMSEAEREQAEFDKQFEAIGRSFDSEEAQQQKNEELRREVSSWLFEDKKQDIINDLLGDNDDE